MKIELEVGAHEEGARLDALLAARPEVGSRSHAQRLIDAGAVTVDGRPRPKRHRVASGERVAVDLEAAEAASASARDATAETVPLDVPHEDEHLLVVDKPAGVVVHPARGHATGTLAQALAGRTAGGAPGRSGIVHRLDRDTSGLLVVAKSADAHRRLEALIRRREVEREYLALVEGRPDARRGTIDAAVGRDRADRTRVSTRTDRPREARTHFELAEVLPRTSLLDVRLETGRTHQIRAHMAAIGHPVCGDRAYGGAECGRRLGLERQFLHAARLAFDHPITATRVDVRSELPADLQAALGEAREERPRRTGS